MFFSSIFVLHGIDSSERLFMGFFWRTSWIGDFITCLWWLDWLGVLRNYTTKAKCPFLCIVSGILHIMYVYAHVSIAYIEDHILMFSWPNYESLPRCPKVCLLKVLSSTHFLNSFSHARPLWPVNQTRACICRAPIKLFRLATHKTLHCAVQHTTPNISLLRLQHRNPSCWSYNSAVSLRAIIN